MSRVCVAIAATANRVIPAAEMQIVFNTRRSVQQSLDHGKGDRVYGIARNRQIVEVHRRHKRKPKQHKKLVFSSAPPRSASPTGRSLKRSGGGGAQYFSAILTLTPPPAEVLPAGHRGGVPSL